MLPYPVLRNKERLWLSIFFALLGGLLGSGFLQAANSIFFTVFGPVIFGWRPQLAPFVPMLAFPGLAFLFWISLRPKPDAFGVSWQISGWRTSVFVLSCAFLFGLFIPANGGITVSIWPWIWLVLSVPLAEELLFRGWVWSIASRMFGGKSFSFTNALPATAVATSICFSFWHFQNLRSFGLGMVLWQVLYSFFASIWLCSLKKTERSITAPVVGHMLLNFMTAFGQYLRFTITQ